MDVIQIIITSDDNTHVIDCVKAKSLASKIKVKLGDHGVAIDMEKFLHVLATHSTIWGAIHIIKMLLLHPANTDELGKGDNNIYDIFYLPTNDPRQIGSVHAARAMEAGTLTMSLAPIISHTPQQHTDIDVADSNGSFSDDSSIPKRHKNRYLEF